MESVHDCHAASNNEPALDTEVLPNASYAAGGFDWENPARMPERFGMGLMLALLALASVAFFLLKLIETPPLTVFFFTLLFTVIAMAQMFFPRAPRMSSAVSGAIYCAVWAVASYLVYHQIRGLYLSIDLIGMALFLGGVSLPFGALVGYAGGGLVAGIFLLLGWRRDHDIVEKVSPVTVSPTADTHLLTG